MSFLEITEQILQKSCVELPHRHCNFSFNGLRLRAPWNSFPTSTLIFQYPLMMQALNVSMLSLDAWLCRFYAQKWASNPLQFSCIRSCSFLQTPLSFIVLKWQKWPRNAPRVVFAQLWFYGGNALCVCVWVLPHCVVPFTLTLHTSKCHWEEESAHL